MLKSEELMKSHPAWPEWQALHPTVRERGFENDFIRFLGVRMRDARGVDSVIVHVEEMVTEDIYRALAEERRPR